MALAHAPDPNGVGRYRAPARRGRVTPPGLLASSGMRAFRSRLVALATLLLSVSVAACLPDGDPFDVELATLNVRVVDQAGMPVKGAVVEVRRSDGTREAVNTTPTFADRPGIAWFLLSAGEYRVYVTPPAGYSALSQNPIRVQLSSREEETVTFTLAKS